MIGWVILGAVVWAGMIWFAVSLCHMAARNPTVSEDEPVCRCGHEQWEHGDDGEFRNVGECLNHGCDCFAWEHAGFVLARVDV